MKRLIDLPRIRSLASDWPRSFIALIVLVGVGITARLWALGSIPLTSDEYFFGSSVLQLLEYGVPRFECGGYYNRGLLQQYLTAPVVAWSGDLEWALRIVPLVANLLGLPAVYLIGRRLGGVPAAFAAVALYSLSIWEIEFARFARMYAPFQALFLWQLVLLLRVVLDGRRSALIWMYVLAGCGILVYEGAVFLIIIAMLPFLTGRVRPTFRDALALAALLVAAVLYLKTDFRFMGAPPLAAEIRALIGAGGSGSGMPLPLLLPPVLAVELLSAFPLALAGLFPLSLAIWAVRRLWLDPDASPAERVVWTAIVASAVLNLFLVALSIWLLAACLARIRSTVRRGSGPAAALGVVLLLLVFWTLFVLTTPGGVMLDGSPGIGRLDDVVSLLFGYPDVYGRMVRRWGVAMPITTGLLLLLLAAGLGAFLWIRRARTPEWQTYGYLFAALLVSILVAAVLETTYLKARYTFFLYPLILLLVVALLAMAAEKVSPRRGMRAAALYSLVLLFALPAEDFGVRHLSGIATPEIAFRTIYDNARHDLYTYRRDFASPGRFINSRLEPDDIVLSAVRVTDLYLDRTDYRYISISTDSFLGYAACGGERELWSNAALVYTRDDLSRIIQDSDHVVWVLGYADDWAGDEQAVLEDYGRYIAYTNIDDTIDVYRIPPAAP